MILNRTTLAVTIVIVVSILAIFWQVGQQGWSTFDLSQVLGAQSPASVSRAPSTPIEDEELLVVHNEDAVEAEPEDDEVKSTDEEARPEGDDHKSAKHQVAGGKKNQSALSGGKKNNAKTPMPTVVCQGQPIPDPFSHKSIHEAYQMFSRTTVKDAFKWYHQAQEKKSAPCELMRELVGRGLRWNYIGMDFSKVWNTSESSKHGGMDPAVKPIFEYYYSPCKICMPVLKADHSLRNHPMVGVTLLAERARQLEQFRREGYVTFDNFNLNIDSLEAGAKKQLEGKDAGDGLSVANGWLPELAPLVKSRDIMELASLYLGSEIKVIGYKVLRLGAHVNRKRYVSGYWHHDGCGSRLKLFVFLQDVKSDKHCPTYIAPGSQNTAYYQYGSLKDVRFLDSYVEKNYKTTKILGERGGGFIFDTNSVHRGQVGGHHEGRDAVIIDISSVSKLKARVPPDGPCPEPNLYRVDETFAFGE